jgi:hypothetical protein
MCVRWRAMGVSRVAVHRYFRVAGHSPRACCCCHLTSCAGVCTLNALRGAQTQNDAFDEGYVLLRPTYPGTYTLSVSVTDGCNWVQKQFRVVVNKLECCPHHAVATGACVSVVCLRVSVSVSVCVCV